ncbi:MAG: cell division protein FtsA [Candidatus Omnitrophica bacterium]|nr:cell division protein FtsA [Candidatus Omnitrophota bacterium]MDD5592301.1 cell division protein FtsA [Candidatus Omnitrophota bacterium]
MFNNYICALDISSSKISAVAAEIKSRHIANIFFETASSKGVKKGAVVNSIDLTGSIGNTLKSLKAKSGMNIKFIYASISGLDIVTKHSGAIIPLAERGNKVITTSDIRQVNEQARILGSSMDEEIIHQITHNYAIDSNNNISNPLGLYSHRLEVDLYLICAKLSFIQSLIRATNQAGYEIKDVFFSGLCTSEAVFNEDLKKGKAILCDIGSDITELLLFKDGVFKDMRILSVGGDDLTLQLSEKLKIPFDLAEDIKRSHGAIGDYSQTGHDKEVLIKQDNMYKPINQKAACEILTSAAKLICQDIKEALTKMCPIDDVNHFIATGRAVLLEGFLETLENTIGTSVKLGRITNPHIISWANNNELLGQKYLTHTTSLGIICHLLGGRKPQFLPDYQTTRNPILNTINKFKEIYQEYF